MAVLLSLTFTAHADELKDLRAEVKELQTAVVDLQTAVHLLVTYEEKQRVEYAAYKKNNNEWRASVDRTLGMHMELAENTRSLFEVESKRIDNLENDAKGTR